MICPQMGYGLPQEIAYAKYVQTRASVVYNLSLWIEPDLDFEHLYLVFLCILKTKPLTANQNLLMQILAGYTSEVRSNSTRYFNVGNSINMLEIIIVSCGRRM